MVHLAGNAKSPEAGARRLEALIHSGEAFARFKQMVQAQGGDVRMIDNLDLLPKAAHSMMAAAPKSGFMASLDARSVGQAGVILGAGRTFMEQKLDYSAGIILDKKVGDPVKKGESVARLYASDPAKLEEAHSFFLSAFQIASLRPKPQPVIRKILK
jgi:pyrimidine-nucleoside phosphorylase